MKLLAENVDYPLNLDADVLGCLQWWWVYATSIVHWYMKCHTGGVMELGKGETY